jgi:uncharacterized protein HemX
MLKLIQRFAATPFSGYLAIALLVAAGGAAYWFWTELKEFGGLEQRAVAQEETIANQNARLEQLSKISEQRQQALTEQQRRTQQLERNERAYRFAIQEARKNVDKVTSECMALHLDDSLQFGPQREDGNSDDKARTGVDG